MKIFALVLATLALSVGCSTDNTSNASDSTTTSAASKDSGSTASADLLSKLTTKVSKEWGSTSSCEHGAPASPIEGSAADEGVDGTLTYGKLDQTHTDGCLTYGTRPGVGGAHNPGWANCGFYTSPVPDENAVHSLEHGAVWIAFDPTKATDPMLATIKKATDDSTHVLASPYPDLGSTIVMSAWSRQLKLDSTDDPRFQKFLEVYVQGPQTPELGAACNGALGTPL